MVVSLDDFQMIIGIEFMHIAKRVSLSLLNSLYMMGANSPYVIPISRGETKDLQQLLTLQLKKGM